MTETLKKIEKMPDLLGKALQLSGLVTRLFQEAGWQLVVVGGSAVEFYTEGAYMSGDIDFCRRDLRPIPLRKAQDLMSQFGATGGPRSWKVAGLYIDLLGLLENEAITPFRNIATPYGPICVVPAELVVVERVMLAYYPSRNAEALAVAKKMLAVCLSGETPIEWDEVNRLAQLPSFDVGKELLALKAEVADDLASQT